MSRSYKKRPWRKDHLGKYMKRVANKRVRQALKNPDFFLPNASYRRFVEQWELCDWREYAGSFHSFFDQEMSYWLHCGEFWGDEAPTKEEVWKVYTKLFRRK